MDLRSIYPESIERIKTGKEKIVAVPINAGKKQKKFINQINQEFMSFIGDDIRSLEDIELELLNTSDMWNLVYYERNSQPSEEDWVASLARSILIDSWILCAKNTDSNKTTSILDSGIFEFKVISESNN